MDLKKVSGGRVFREMWTCTPYGLLLLNSYMTSLLFILIYDSSRHGFYHKSPRSFHHFMALDFLI